MDIYSGKHLHIVSFNVPYPPDYGGVIDVFYKIKALSELGIKIHLHCFTYGREESKELNDICEEVALTTCRKNVVQGLFTARICLISSVRGKASELLANLAADEHPVLFEVPAHLPVPQSSPH